MTEYRFEFKYILTPHEARVAEGFVRSAGMHEDDKAPLGFYPVTSLYFDTPHRGDYHDKSGGFLRRTKIRARIYAPRLTPEINEIWLEEKARHDAVTRKSRALLSQESFKRLLQKGAPALLRSLPVGDKEGALPLLSKIILGARQPALLVQYLRRPYVGFFQGERVRITFDYNLRVCAKPDLWYPFSWIPIEPNRVVMEVKFKSELPKWFGTLIKFLELERVSISKYGRAVEAVRSLHPIPR